MISEKIKQKLLEEIKKHGIVYIACLKVGIDKSTYYRWKKKNKKFRALAEEAEEIGNSNYCDMAEYTVAKNVKKGDQRAAEFVLVHRSKKYRPKRAKVTIEHKKITNPVSEVKQLTLEDLIYNDEENLHENSLALKEQLTQYGKKIPNKPDGSPIGLYELREYQAYIENWQENEEKKKQEKLMQEYKKSGIIPSSTDTADSKSSTDKPEAEPQENHKIQDTSHSSSSSHHNPPDSNS